jgi:hypothetical protein
LSCDLNGTIIELAVIVLPERLGYYLLGTYYLFKMQKEIVVDNHSLKSGHKEINF